ATAEYVQKHYYDVLLFNNVRPVFRGGKLSQVYVQGSTAATGLLISGLNTADAPVYSMFTTPTTFSMTMSVPKPQNGTTMSTTKYTGPIYIGKYITVPGESEPVLSVTQLISEKETIDRYYTVVEPVEMEAQYVDGVKQDSPAIYKVIMEEDRYVTGSLGLYENGKAMYENDEMPYLANNTAYNTTMIRWSTSAGVDMYAARYYNRVLSQTEMQKNRIADVAKWFRLNMDGIEDLEDPAVLCKALEDIDFYTSTRMEAQIAMLSVLGPAKRAAYLENAAEYAEDVSEADLNLLRTYGLDPAPIANLPAGALDVALLLLDDLAKTPDYQYAAARYAMAIGHYATLANTANVELYNALYVDEGLFFHMDFFSTNEYWGGDAVTIATAGANKQYAPYVRIKSAAGGSISGGTGVIENGYYLMDQSSVNGTYMSLVFNGGTLSADNAQVTAEYVQQYDVAKNAQFYIRGRWVNTEGSVAGLNGMTLCFNALWDSIHRYNPSAGTWGAHWTTLSSLSKKQYAIGDRAMPLTFVFDAGGFATSTTATDGHSLLTVYAPDLDQPIVSLSKLSGGALMLTDPNKFMNNNGTLGDTENPSSPPGKYLTTDESYQSGNGKQYVGGYYGVTDKNLSGWTDRIGYDNSFAGRIYAIRYYDRALSQEETWQNHFADLAKFFRLNITEFSALTPEEKLEVYKAMRDLDLATSTREEVQEAYLGALRQVVLDRYADADIPAEFLELTANYNLDLTDLLTADRDMSKLYPAMMNKNLRGKSFAEAQEIYRDVYAAVYNYYSYAVDGQDAWNGYLDVLAEKKLAADGLMGLPFAMRQGAIGLDTQAALDAYVKDASSVVDLAGMQVRLETGLAETDMPGVRAVFTIDEEELLALVKQYDTVTFGVEIAVSGVAKKHLTFTATSDGNGKYVLVGLDGAKTRMIQTGESTEVLGFVYTVTYKNYNKGTEGYEAYYEKDFSYRTFLTVDEETPLTQDVWHPIFEGSVSAKEVYQHFLDNDASYEYDFASDKILQAVLGTAPAVTE
ncbi:MAG: hypothetical protein J6R33_03195, partial [Clostridia bacterium]|nr:hypothetical protein [Clostridia bacterium]